MPFPRHWTFPAIGIGVAASINMPGAPGVTHVLESVTADFVAFGSAGTLGPILTAYAGGSSGTVLMAWRLEASSPTGAEVGQDSMSLTGLELATLPGQSLLVQFDTIPPAGWYQNLVIQGRDE
jgi:hypothetical protein